MKTKLFAILITAILLCACLPFGTVSAAEGDKTYGPLSYAVNGGTVYITDCDDDVVEVLIPAEIAGKPVTHIGDDAFADCKQLTSITFFSSLYAIGGNAFAGCDALTEVHYRGTEEQRENMMLWWDGNYVLLRATWHYELPGDVDGNGKVNNRDLGWLQKYLNGADVTIETDLADLNGDGKINNRDLGKLRLRLNGSIQLDSNSNFNDGELWWK